MNTSNSIDLASNSNKSSNRIEYIDAMRGFTMLLVVMCHVTTFDLGFYGSETFSINTILQEFRMPLFFFVSGFVLFKSEFNWGISNTIQFLKKKFSVQILSPLIFLTFFVAMQNLSIVDALYDYQKQGYWFTFTLFEYFIIYILLQWGSTIVRLKGIFKDIVFVTFGLILYCLTIYPLLLKYNMFTGIYSLIGIPTLHNFLFFIIGNRVRKNFEAFERLLDTKYFTLLCVMIFFTLNTFPLTKHIGNTLWQLLVSTSGICIVFALFRKNATYLTNETRMGRIAQYVGRRTLDVYLLHYFFIFTNMQSVLPNFSALNTPFLEFILSLSLSVCVILVCLLVSKILRLSPIMAHYLFGQKLDKQ